MLLSMHIFNIIRYTNVIKNMPAGLSGTLDLIAYIVPFIQKKKKEKEIEHSSAWRSDRIFGAFLG